MARGMVVIDEDRCKACNLCVVFCPHNVLRLAEGRFNAIGYPPAEAVDMDRCTGCEICAVMCPDVCFKVYRQRKSTKAA